MHDARAAWTVKGVYTTNKVVYIVTGLTAVVRRWWHEWQRRAHRRTRRQSGCTRAAQVATKSAVAAVAAVAAARANRARVAAAWARRRRRGWQLVSAASCVDAAAVVENCLEGRQSLAKQVGWAPRPARLSPRVRTRVASGVKVAGCARRRRRKIVPGNETSAKMTDAKMAFVSRD